MAGSICRCLSIHRKNLANKLLVASALALVASALPAQQPQPQSQNNKKPSYGFSSGITLDTKVARGSEAISDAPSANALTWWQTPSDNSELQLLRVGPYLQAPDSQTAVGLWFSQAFSAKSGYSDQLAIYATQSGKRITGKWQRAPDPKLLYFIVPTPGRYLVRVRAGLRDAEGHTFNYSLSGPVEIPPAAAAP